MFPYPSSSSHPRMRPFGGREGGFDCIPADLGPDPLRPPPPSCPTAPPPAQSDVRLATSSPDSNPLPATLSTLRWEWGRWLPLSSASGLVHCSECPNPVPSNRESFGRGLGGKGPGDPLPLRQIGDFKFLLLLGQQRLQTPKPSLGRG